jgi:hypothetical protein
MPSKAEIAEARTEAAAAMEAGGSSGAAGANVLNIPQSAVVAGAGVDTAIIGPGVFISHESGRVNAFAYTSGALGAGYTSCLFSLQTSVDGGATWVTQFQTRTPGSAAEDTAVALGGFVALLPVNPVVPTQWRVIAHPVGGTYTTTAPNQGNLFLQEIPPS